MRRKIALLASFALLAGAGAAAHERPSPSSAQRASTTSASDEAFVREAAQGGKADVALATLAKQKGENSSVRKLAARVHADHMKANAKLKQIADQKGWELPDEPTPEQRKELDKLQTLDGADFDRAYLEAMIKDHQKDIEAFEQQSAEGTDAALKSFAESTLPDLQTHLSMATNAQSSLTG